MLGANDGCLVSWEMFLQGPETWENVGKRGNISRLCSMDLNRPSDCKSNKQCEKPRKNEDLTDMVIVDSQ